MDWFMEMLVEPRFDGFPTIIGLAIPSHGDAHSVPTTRLGTQPFRNLKAVHAGQTNIEDD